MWSECRMHGKELNAYRKFGGKTTRKEATRKNKP
jgi:hypothetical protein